MVTFALQNNEYEQNAPFICTAIQPSIIVNSNQFNLFAIIFPEVG